MRKTRATERARRREHAQETGSAGSSKLARSGGSYQGSEHYQKRAREEGYPARSVYKLEEIDGRCRVLREGQTVVDLGAAPGSWSIYASKKVGFRGRVLAVDVQPLRCSLPPGVVFSREDAFALTPTRIRDLFAGTASPPLSLDGTMTPGVDEAVTSADQGQQQQPSGPVAGEASALCQDGFGGVSDVEEGGVEKVHPFVDVVLSDMAPNTTGNRGADKARSHALFMHALQVAGRVLRPGGHFVGKLFQGPDFEEARSAVRDQFETLKLIRPGATRTLSYEIFLVGLGFKGRQQSD